MAALLGAGCDAKQDPPTATASGAPATRPAAPPTPANDIPTPPTATPPEPADAPLPAEAPVDAAAVQQLVDAWLAAQNADDFAAYEKLYAPKMEGIKRSGPRTRRFDRAGWIADRKKMFDGKPMTVALRDLRIGGSAAAPTASFVQSFKQGNFADEGPKQLVLTRGPDGLRIAREELLASVIGGATPVTAGPIALVVEVDGKQHVVITGDADPAWGTGPIHGPFAGAHKYATRAASKAPAAAAWAGKAMIVYNPDDGASCPATVGALRLLGGGTPHFGEVQVWDGDPAMSPDGRVWSRAERARAVYGMGSLYLVGELAITGACKPAYATDAAARVVAYAREPLDDTRRAAALRAFRALPAYAELQRVWKDEFAGKGEWTDPDPIGHVAGDRRYIVVSAHEGAGCGDFEGALTAVFAVEGAALRLVSDPEGGALEIDALVDSDGDGKVELIGRPGDWSVVSAHLTPTGAGFTPSVTLAFPFRDCGC